MASMARAAQNWQQNIQVAVRENTAAAITKALQKAALREQFRVVSEQHGRAGVAPQLQQMILNGRRIATTSQITEPGRVVLDWNYLHEAIQVVVNDLRAAGPVVTGKWKQNVMAFVEDTEWDPAVPPPPDKQEAWVAVKVPYARRLEVGKRRDGKPFVVQVPYAFVQGRVAGLRARLQGIAVIDFSYIDLSGGYNIKTPGYRRRKRQATEQVKYPAIRIRELGL